MNEIWEAVIPVAISVVVALGGFIVSWLNARKAKNEAAQAAEEAKKRLDTVEERQAALEKIIGDAKEDYAVVCPACGETILLRKVDIFVKGEIIDEEATK